MNDKLSKITLENIIIFVSKFGDKDSYSLSLKDLESTTPTYYHLPVVFKSTYQKPKIEVLGKASILKISKCEGFISVYKKKDGTLAPKLVIVA